MCSDSCSNSHARFQRADVFTGASHAYFPQGDAFRRKACAGNKMVLYQKLELGNWRSRVAKNTAFCGMCTLLHLTVAAKLSERCGNWSQMFGLGCTGHPACGCGCQKTIKTPETNKLFSFS